MATERVAIVGSREYPDLAAVKAYVRALPGNVVVVTGAWWDSDSIEIVAPTSGVDNAAAYAARARGLVVDLCVANPLLPPDGKRLHRRSAGPRRNRPLVESADRVVAFWDGESKGTADAIAHARKLGKPVEVITPQRRPA